MPFQPQSNSPDLLSLALNLRQMKIDEDQRREELRIAKIKALGDARAAEAQNQKDILEIQEKRLAIGKAQTEAGEAATGRVATLFETANAENVSPELRQANANQAVGFLEDRIASGVPPESAGANVARVLGEREVKVSREIDKERRTEERAKRTEQRAANRLAAQERRAAENDGRWEREDLVKWGDDRRKESDFAFNLSRDHRMLKSLNPDDPTDIFQVVQTWQRRVDEGASVREGDIAMIQMANASGYDNLKAWAKGFLDRDEAYPPGFGERLFSSLDNMLNAEDEKLLGMAANWEQYAEQNNWGERERRLAFSMRTEVERAARRQGVPTPREAKIATEAVARSLGVSPEEVSPAVVIEFWKTSKSSGGR